MSNEGLGNLFVIASPSGGGKTTLCRLLRERLAPTVRFSVSHTTRPPRGREQDGVDYYFVGEVQFEQMVKNQALAEWACVHGHYYGTSKREIQRAQEDRVDLLLDIDWQGAEQLAARYPGVVRIFVMPPSMAELHRRLAGRGTDDAAQIELRLNNAKKEMAYAAQCDFVVVNDNLEKAARCMEAIVLAQRCRRENQLDAIRRFDSAQKGAR